MQMATERQRLVLLVDDDADISAALSEVLVEEGYAVHAVPNGKEALNWLRETGTSPCVILLDMMMPVMDGVGFLQARKASSRLSSIPVIVVSAENGWRVASRAQEVLAFCPKPIALDDLFAIVDRCA